MLVIKAALINRQWYTVDLLIQCSGSITPLINDLTLCRSSGASIVELHLLAWCYGSVMKSPVKCASLVTMFGSQQRWELPTSDTHYWLDPVP